MHEKYNSEENNEIKEGEDDDEDEIIENIDITNENE